MSSNIPDAASRLADFIREHAKDGRQTPPACLRVEKAVHLAPEYPNIIGDCEVFVSGRKRLWDSSESWYNWSAGSYLYFRQHSY